MSAGVCNFYVIYELSVQLMFIPKVALFKENSYHSANKGIFFSYSVSSANLRSDEVSLVVSWLFFCFLLPAESIYTIATAVERMLLIEIHFSFNICHR